MSHPKLERDSSESLRLNDPRALYERHLAFDHVLDPRQAGPRERFEAVARVLRDLLTERWIKTNRTHDEANPKRVYYLSMEFLIGRSLSNNLINLMAEPLVRELIEHSGLDLAELADQEPDAGLGNGGLGRLAACFIDSMATLQIPAMGYGLRYEYGIFRQDIKHGFQVESPDNWLRLPDPWEIARPNEKIDLRIGSGALMSSGDIKIRVGQPMTIVGTPFDRPVVGYGGRTINTLRLWSGSASDFFDLDEFNSGDFFGAVHDKVLAENLTRVLYPDDSTAVGQGLRFVQEYFLVACSIDDILKRFRRYNDDWRTLPDKVAIQLNDTHPALAVAELMRHLLDHARLNWDDAWDITRRTLAYTNHTLLPEALEKWQVRFFEWFLPRHLEIIYGINARFMDEVRRRYPDEHARHERMSIIEESPERKVRMANLAILGTHSTNGVAEIHSELLRTRVVRDFAEMFPERFGNQTNGVTPRRWLLMANPDLSALIGETIGGKWITHLEDLEQLKPLAEDGAFRQQFRAAKRKAKTKFIDWLRAQGGPKLEPDAIFDSQIKRIHEYKRQLLNALHVVVLYNRLRHDPSLRVPPRVIFFAGKAAPAYTLAKLIIKLINNISAVIDRDPSVRGRLKVMFLPNYSVTLAERLIPATDLSEQISTAGYEASGTGNMKFMMNGALTIGTRDGATIEMAREAGEDNFFMFGLNADQVAHSRNWYSPWWHYHNDPETRAAVDLIFNDHFSPYEKGIFLPIRDVLLTRGDYYMHLADLTSYVKAQNAVNALYIDPEAWTRKAVLNVAASGRFSSDRTIRGYAEHIWKARSVPVDR
ncbi:MAG: glycogen/starch/alpha-glucan phosphorylase [Planctomycetia bacterium]|nr:glycogen/starch/alpha-glucan phosphorylase [Planctomycetia bacterium]